MLCSTCNNEIEPDTLVCPHCRAMHAFNQQQLKVGNIQKKQRQTIAKSFKSPYFLAYMVAVIFVMFVHIGIFLGLAIPVANDIFYKKLPINASILELILVLCFVAFAFAPIKTMKSAIQLHFMKQEDEIPVKMEGLKSLSGFWRKVFKIIRNIIIFLFVLTTIFMIVMLFAVNEATKEMETVGDQAASIGFEGVSSIVNIVSNGLTTSAIIGFIVFLVVGICLIVLFTRCSGTYEKIIMQYSRLSDFYTSGGFNEYSTISVGRLYVLGVAFLMLGGLTFWGGDLLINGLWSFGGIFLSNGIFLIFNGIFLKHTEQEQRKTYLEYKLEKAKLDEIREESNAIQLKLLRQARERGEVK